MFPLFLPSHVSRDHSFQWGKKKQVKGLIQSPKKWTERVQLTSREFGLRPQHLAKPSLTLRNTRSKTKSLYPRTLPIWPWRAMGSWRLPANVQETKQMAVAVCPKSAWDFARYLHVLLAALSVTVQLLCSLPRWQLSQRNDLVWCPKLHTQLYHTAVSASSCSQPVFPGALLSWVFKSRLMSSRYTRHLLEITLCCLGQGAAFCLCLPSGSPAPEVLDKHQPWQANWVSALGSISPYIFTTTQLKNQTKWKPKHKAGTLDGM